MNKLFRYSGSKTKYLKYYRNPPEGVKRVVEPYVGSAAYILNSGLSGVGYEINNDIYEMWMWLKTVSENDLLRLNSFLDGIKEKGDKIDIRTLNLEKGPETYIRVNVCSAMVGQLSSWKIYNKHNLPIGKTINSLPLLANIEIFNCDGESHIEQDGDLFFIDPPYINTSPNYTDQSKEIQDVYNPSTTDKFVRSLTCPVIFTYGSSAPQVFPDYNWQIVKEVKVPNLRNGGTVTRNEYVCYLNF